MCGSVLLSNLHMLRLSWICWWLVRNVWMCLSSRRHTSPNPGSPWLLWTTLAVWDANKFSMTCLSGRMHTCGGHSHREGFHEAPNAGRELRGKVLLENKPAQLGHRPSTWWGHCGMCGLNVWVQVWPGAVQAKEKEISRRQTGTNMMFFQGKNYILNENKKPWRSWGAPTPSSFPSVNKAGTCKAAAKQTRGVWVQGTWQLQLAPSQPQSFVLLGLKTFRVAVPDSGLI